MAARPFRYDDPQGKLNPRGKTSFRWIPNGIPGIETYAGHSFHTSPPKVYSCQLTPSL